MKFLSDFKKIDVSIVNIMRLGFRFSFILCIFFTYILFLYTLHPFSHVFFDIGYLGVKCSFMFFVVKSFIPYLYRSHQSACSVFMSCSPNPMV